MSNDPFGPNPNQNPTPFGAPPPNPYASPAPQSYAQPQGSFAPGGPFKEDMPGQPWSMDYFGFYGMIQRNPNWLGNSFMVGLCGLIPIVGAMVVSGYTYENAVLLHRTGGANHQPFDFNRFGDYLGRGVGPFLIGIVFWVINQVIGFAMQLVIGGMGAALDGGGGGDDAAAATAGIVMIALTLLTIPVQLFLALMQQPMMMRGGMTSDIGQAFQISFAFDFLKKCWLESFLAMLLVGLMMIPAILLGIITCCIGMLPVIGYFSLVQAWMSFQLYRLYLSRGGEPMPIKMPPMMQVTY